MLARLFPVCVAAAVLLALPILKAQEGHPLTGSWHGEWGAANADAKQKTTIVMAMKWNNTAVEATLNPGRNGVPAKVTLDPEKWMVHIEADLKDGQHVVADGKLEDIGSYNRTISGNWQQGTFKGQFKLRRD